jgi:hypothetical protein
MVVVSLPATGSPDRDIAGTGAIERVDAHE